MQEAAPIVQISYSLGNIESAANQLWQYANQYRVWAFSGEMGAGKTTLISTLCKSLGVKDAVSSPTFAIINEYLLPINGGERKIYHMDWYRINDEEEAINAGIEDCMLQKDNFSLIEWPEKAPSLLTSPYLWIEIKTTSPTERVLEAFVK